MGSTMCTGPQDTPPLTGLRPWLLLFASGACALLAEVLWPRVLAPTLGGTARAEALVLAAIFVGLALGGALGARLADRAGPRAGWGRAWWRRWAACEAAGAVAMLLLLWAPVGGSPLLALLLLVAPAVAAGAAWPLAVALTGGRSVAGLYAVATAGGLVGATVGAFGVAEHLGARVGVQLAVVGMLVVGVAALACSRSASGDAGADAPAEPAAAPSTGDAMGAAWPWVAGVASGAVVLGAEALHARLLAGRLPLTGYAFAAVVVTWLAGMAAGGLVGRAAAKAGVRGLGRLLAVAGVLLAIGPHAAGRAAPLTESHAFAGEALTTLLEMLRVVLPGALVAGAVFPCAAALVAARAPDPARALGRLAGLNALAALVGALGATRLLLPSLGPGGALAALAALVGLLGVACVAYPGGGVAGRRAEALVALVALAALVGTAPPRVPPVLAPGERVVDLRDGPGASVAVLEDASGARRLVADGRYTLGDSASFGIARRLALLPYALRPRPARALLVGLATGITAGGACDAAATCGGRVVAAELLPEAADLRAWFAAWRGSSARRPEVVVDDGRLVLERDVEGFDLVVVDLVVPWHAGTGLLWGVEALERARARLRPGGALAFWLPLYQTSPEGLVRTLAAAAQAFPDARAVAGSLDPERPLLLVMAGAAGPDVVEAERARLAAAGALDPLLAMSGAVAALDLGPIAPVLDALARRLEVERRDPVREADQRLELEGARARARGSSVTGDRFRTVVAAFDEARGLRPDGLTPAQLAVRASWAGDPLTGGRMFLEAARRQEGDDRARSLLAAARALRAVSPEEALAALLALTPQRTSSDAWTAVAIDGAQLALLRREAGSALALVERLVDPPVLALVLAALAEDGLGRRDAARERLVAAAAKDPDGARAAVSSMGLEAWATALASE